MKIPRHIPQFLLLSIITSMMVSACSSRLDAKVSISDEIQFEDQQQPAVEPSSNLGAISVKFDRSDPEGIRIFEGDVFVASTKPKTGRWKSAGWRIAKKPHSVDSETVPSDCTLYPHKGVENQWIGSCSGFIYIPIDGAKHIAVVLTHPDGNTTHVQVAPIPNQ